VIAIHAFQSLRCAHAEFIWPQWAMVEIRCGWIHSMEIIRISWYLEGNDGCEGIDREREGWRNNKVWLNWSKLALIVDIRMHHLPVYWHLTVLAKRTYWIRSSVKKAVEMVDVWVRIHVVSTIRLIFLVNVRIVGNLWRYAMVQENDYVWDPLHQ